MNANKPIENSTKPFMGILMLDSRFPRILGDIGNPQSFDFPVKRTVIHGAQPDTVIRHSPEHHLPKFIKAAQKFETDGARLITTSCGFLTLFQKELENAVDIPVLTSSLFLYSKIREGLSQNRKVGILTIAASNLTTRHLEAAGIHDNPPIGTTENGEEFTRAILDNQPQMDINKARHDNVQAAIQLKSDNPDLGAILLECTNMPPYQKDIEIAAKLPVYSIIDGLTGLWKDSPKQ